MNSLEIVKCIQQDVKARRIFRGIFPHDWLLPTLEKLRFEQKPYVIVCNTHDSSIIGAYNTYQALLVVYMFCIML